MDPNLRLLGGGVAVRMLGNALFFPFLAIFLHAVLGVGFFAIGVIIAGVGLAQLPFNLLGGFLTDRVGRRRLILLGFAIEAATTAGMAYAFGIKSLAGAILAATVGGMVGNATGPAFSAYIADYAEGSERTRGYTWFRIGFNAGYSAGVTLGGLLVSLLDFATTVGIAAVIIAAGGALMYALLAPSPYDERLARGAVASTPDASGPSPARGIRHSLRILAADRPALEMALAFALASVLFGQWAVTFPLYVRNVLGVSYPILGAGLALNGLIVVFGQSFTTERVIGMRHSTIGVIGTVLYAAAFLSLGAAGLWSIFPVGVFFVAVVVLTFGENLVTIPTSTLPSNLAPPSEIGAYNGAFQTVGAAGFLVAVLIGGAVLSFTPNPLLIWALLVLPGIPAIILLRHAATRIPIAADRA